MMIPTSYNSFCFFSALWSALHHGIDSNNPYGINSAPLVQPIAAVGLAAVSDLMDGCLTSSASTSAIQNLHGVSNCNGVDPYKAYTSPFEMLNTAIAPVSAFSSLMAVMMDLCRRFNHKIFTQPLRPIPSSQLSIFCLSMEKIILMLLTQAPHLGQPEWRPFWIVLL